MAAAGQTVKEIRRNLGIPDVLYAADGSAAPAPPMTQSPMEEALDTREKMMAQRIQDNMERQQAAEAETLTKRAEIGLRKESLELGELEAKVRESRGPGETAAMIDRLGEFIQTTMSQQATEVQALRTEITTNLREEIVSMRQTFVDLQTKEQPTPPSVISQLGELKDVYDRLKDMFGPGPAVTATTEARNGHDLDTMITLQKMRQDHDIRMAELQGSESREDARLGMERERLEDDKRRGAVLGDSLTRAMPEIQRVIASVGERMMGSNGSTPAAPAAAPTAPYPTGTQLHSCTGCRVGVIPFPPGITTATCPECDLEHELPPEGAPVEDRVVEEPPAEATEDEAAPELVATGDVG